MKMMEIGKESETVVDADVALIITVIDLHKEYGGS